MGGRLAQVTALPTARRSGSESDVSSAWITPIRGFVVEPHAAFRQVPEADSALSWDADGCAASPVRTTAEGVRKRIPVVEVTHDGNGALWLVSWKDEGHTYDVVAVRLAFLDHGADPRFGQDCMSTRRACLTAVSLSCRPCYASVNEPSPRVAHPSRL